jgi:peroxiredoxin
VSAHVPAWSRTGTSAQLTVGQPLPSLAFASTFGGIVDLTHVARAVVFIYPWSGRPGVPNPPHWDDIPGAHGSTPQAEGFRDHHTAFAAAGWSVYGLSTQPTAWQRELSDRLTLPYALLSDETFALADALHLPRFTTGGVAYLERLTLILRDGVIAAVLHPIPHPAAHAREVLDRIGLVL